MISEPIPTILPLNSSRRIERRKKGFALVSTIIIMSLLMIVSVSMLSISSVLTKSSSFNTHKMRAEANAKMALMIAIGELQKYSGRDQTITSRSDLLDPRTTPDEKSDSMRQPHYTMAFQTKPLNDDYSHAQYGEGMFIRQTDGMPAVLVSGNERFDMLDVSLTAYPAGYTHENSEATEYFVTVFGNHLTPEHQVKVPRVSTHSGKNRGSYAYWVSGENTKSRINIHDQYRINNSSLSNDSNHDETAFNSLRTPPSPGLNWSGNDEARSKGFLESLVHKPDEIEKILSSSSISLISDVADKEMLAIHQHDFTTTSSSVLSNAKHGGLKKNLTAAINQNDAEFDKLILHRGDESSKADPVFLFQKYSFPIDSADPDYLRFPGAVWELFRSNVRRPEWEPELTGKSPSVLAHLGGNAHKVSHYWEENSPSNTNLKTRLVRRTPVLQRFQVAIDYSMDYDGKIAAPDKDGNAAEWYEFSMRQHFIPMVSYWNPYDTTLTTGDTHSYSIHNNRDYGTHQNHSNFKASFIINNTEWRYLAMKDRSAKVEWSEEQTGEANFVFPFHPTGGVNASKYDKTNYGFKIRKFTLAPGETATFAIDGESLPLKYDAANYLERITDITKSVGYSFYVKTAKIRVKVKGGLTVEDAVPDLTLLRYPTSGGDQLTRLNVTNSTTFQQTNLNFGSVSSSAKITFTPTLIKDDEPLPSSDVNGTESPKLAGVIIRKSVDFSHYYPNGKSWDKISTGFDSNPYNAPFQQLYNPYAARQGAYGRVPGSNAFIFSSPFMYLAGVLVSRSDFDLISPQITQDGKTFVGYNDTVSGGSAKSIQISLPRAEARIASVGQLRNMNLSKWVSGYNANQDFASLTDSVMQNNAIGNSFASPHIAPNRTAVEAYDSSAYSGNSAETYALQYDNSYRYNEALWDRYFMTGTREGEISDIEQIRTSLPNQNLTLENGITVDEFKSPHDAAAHLMIKGGFNVNSTSVEAWKTLLSSTVGLQTSATDSQDSDLVPFPVLLYSDALPLTSPPTDVSQKSLYDGSTYRALTEDEVSELAKQIVAQNKLRGPYSSLAQFVNRSLGPEHHYRQAILGQTLTTDQVCYEGPLQAAINQTAINGALNTPAPSDQYPNQIIVNTELAPTNSSPNSYTDYQRGKINLKALKYHPGFGYNSTLTQADILSQIGHLLTVRSDTFTIRAYGESKDNAGNIVATAFCEAVVQRTPQWINAADNPTTPPSSWTLEESHRGSWKKNDNLSEISQKFGRRYVIKSFRWLANNEI